MHCEPDAGPTRVANVLALYGRDSQWAEAQLGGTVQATGCQPAGDEEASPTLADESDDPSLPTKEDEKLEEVQGDRWVLTMVL